MLLPFVLTPTTVELRLKIVPVSEAVAALARASGMRLETDRKVADRKITVLVERADARETMARIADVMRLRWVEKGDTMLLTLDPVLEGRERAQIEAERDAIGRIREASLRAQAAEVAVSAEARAKREKDAEEAFLKAWKDKPDEESRLDALGRWGDAKRTPSALGVALASLDAAEWGRLLSGETMLLSTGPNPLGRPIPSTAIDLIPRYPGQPEVNGLDILVRLTPPGELGGVTEAYRFVNGGWGSSGLGIPSGPPQPLRLPVRTRLTEELKAWDQSELMGREAKRRLDGATEERRLGWPLAAQDSHVPRSMWNVSDSDRLEWLHDASGLDIVARADRLASSEGRRRFEGTVAEFVRDWRAHESLGQRDAFRLVGQTLMYRPARYWVRAQEPSEATLRAFEAKTKPGLDDWADFAARLTLSQARSLAYGAILLRRSADPLVSHTALRFWAILSPAQREKARSTPLGVDDFDASQREAYVRTVVEASFDGRFRPTFVVPLLAGEASKVRFALPGGGGPIFGGGVRRDGTNENFEWSMTFGPNGNGIDFTIARPTD